MFKKEILTDKSLAVNCKTEEQAKKLLKWAHKNGKCWRDGKSYLNRSNQWKTYKDKSCYRIASGHFSDMKCYNFYNYKIISYEEALEMENKVVLDGKEFELEEDKLKLAKEMLGIKDKEVEVWKAVTDYEEYYEVSNKGRVRSLKKSFSKKVDLCNHNKEFYYLKTYINNHNREVVFLTKDKERKQFFIHRLIAIEFIPNPENKPTVNHIDENPLNNSITNLEWATFREQLLHNGLAKRSGMKRRNNHLSKPIAKTKDDEIIIQFPSIQEAIRAGYNSSNLCRWLRTGMVTREGYVWKYLQDWKVGRGIEWVSKARCWVSLFLWAGILL